MGSAQPHYGFGIISIFGIEERCLLSHVLPFCFGIISIFGIEEQTVERQRANTVLVSSQFLV